MINIFIENQFFGHFSAQIAVLLSPNCHFLNQILKEFVIQSLKLKPEQFFVKINTILMLR
jgi:hypothetical protein